MITDKLELTREILEEFPDTRGDGAGMFLNRVYVSLHGDKIIDFEIFNTESWVRSRRKILEQCPFLDNRTSLTNKLEMQMKSEVRK